MNSKSSKNADGIYEPFASNEVPMEVFKKGDRFEITYQQLGQFGGCSHVGVCLEELAPGKQTYPAHYHMLEEEHVFILEGGLTLQLGERKFDMNAGDYVCFPAGQKAGHTLINTTDQACKYLVIGERNDNDVIVYTDSGRVGVRLTGEGYRASETMDYWEGVVSDDD